jgi:hypothetical protein
MPKNPKKLVECARLQWKFMRRNQDYRLDYNIALELRMAAGYPSTIGKEKYKSSDEGGKEKKISGKWFSSDVYLMLDPNRTWTQLLADPHNEGLVLNASPYMNLIEVPSEFTDDYRYINEYFLIKAFNVCAVKIVHDRIWSARNFKLSDLSPDDLVLQINFKNVHSLEELRNYVEKIIDEYASMEGKIETPGRSVYTIRPKIIEPIKRPDKYKIGLEEADECIRVYDECLRVWGAAEPPKRPGWGKIAAASLDKKERSRPDLTAAKCYRKCQELVSGGYKKIRYP